MTAARALALAVLALAGGLAGCVQEEAPPAVADGNATGRIVPDVDEEDLAAFEETNATEDGLGGMAHDHDYWLGRDRVVVLSDEVFLFPLPVFGDGSAVSSSTIELQPDELVYEGTAHVEVVVSRPSVLVADYPVGGVRLQYLTSLDGPDAWRDAGAVQVDQPVAIPVKPEEADMPHSETSLWLFRLLADGPHVFSVNLTVTAVRGEDVKTWPGHPDFYAERNVRTIFSGDASSRFEGYHNILLYGEVRSWIHPERLISWGTTRLDVFVNVTRNDSPGGDPETYFLMVRNATCAGRCLPERYFDEDGTEDLTSYHFVIPVDAQGMDSPYAPLSRWSFNLASRYAQLGNTMPYTVDYHLTILATGESGSG